MQHGRQEIEQITKADRNARHALCSKGKARATLRRHNSNVVLHAKRQPANKLK